MTDLSIRSFPLSDDADPPSSQVTITAPPEHGKENSRSPPIVLAAGRMHLVDLAGSERLSKTCMAEADMVKEAGCINKSLGTLGEVRKLRSRSLEMRRSWLAFQVALVLVS